MYKGFFAMALLAMLALPGITYALSESEYQYMMRNSNDFRRADQELQRCWKTVYDSLWGAEKRQLLENQRWWIRQGRDDDAWILINRGMSRQAAYTQAVRERINYLWSRLGNDRPPRPAPRNDRPPSYMAPGPMAPGYMEPAPGYIIPPQ